jgi:hypothetical protein
VFAPAEEGPPEFRELWPEAGVCEIVEFLSDDLAPRQSEQPACAGAGVMVIAVVVGDQNGDRRVIDDGAKEKLEFSWTVLQKPTGGGCL